ncbi:unnamed protein product [Durusdinium trenchii]|uniref:Uncharacterized protein n=1 Tax=Durusdinium trenchii TaxID=1381693 RepID=A0ABP0MDD8_9DINO
MWHCIVLRHQEADGSSDVVPRKRCGLGSPQLERRRTQVRALPQEDGATWQDAIRLLAEAQQLRAVPIEAYEEAAERCRDAAPLRVERLLEEVKEAKLSPSRRLYQAVVVSYGDAQSWQKALHWLLEARQSAGLTTQMMSSFLLSCVKVEDWDLAWPQALYLLVDACPRWGLVPSSEHFALVLQSLPRNQVSWRIATELLAEMKLLGLQYTPQCYGGAAHTFALRWQGALELLLEARQRSVQTAIHPTVENLAEEARRGAEALRPFWDAAPSRRSLLARWSHALDLFFQEIQCGSPQTLEDYRAAIKACPRFYWKLCLHLLEQMKTSLGPDRLSYREAMRTCNRGLYSYEAALGLFEDMTVQQLEPTVEEHNEVLLAYITGNRWEEAFRHFAKMQSEGPPPNVQSYCMVLYACADSSEVTAWSSAIRYWSDMREDKITPDFDAYDMLLLVAERSERWDWSRQLLDTLFKLNAPYTVTMFNAALNAARRGKRWELAQSLIRDMSDELLLPTIVSYSFAVDACEKADRFDVATQLLESVDELDLKT